MISFVGNTSSVTIVVGVRNSLNQGLWTVFPNVGKMRISLAEIKKSIGSWKKD
jgi:hypothetical protein